MRKKYAKDQMRKNLESFSERLGGRIAEGVSKKADTQKGAQIGRKLGQTLAERLDRVHERLENEPVTKEEELGIGGKVGTGLGVIGKHLVEKRYGRLGTFMSGADFVSEGRTLGAKGEKIVKRGLKTGLEHIARKRKKTE